MLCRKFETDFSAAIFVSFLLRYVSFWITSSVVCISAQNLSRKYFSESEFLGISSLKNNGNDNCFDHLSVNSASEHLKVEDGSFIDKHDF